MREGGLEARRGAVLLTGATGYLGERILARLARSGRSVRCLVLPGDPAASIQCFPLRDRKRRSDSS